MNNYRLKELIPKWLAFCCTSNLVACPVETGKFCPFEYKKCISIKSEDWDNILELLYNDFEQEEKSNES